MSFASSSLGLQIPRKRRVFFSFHYQYDIWRVNQIRNSWRYQREQDRISEGFFDGSIWERAQRTSPESLKNLIREGIKNTSVTCVLAGSQTYARRWVRYEIARSLVKGNGLLVVDVNNLQDHRGAFSKAGPNPLSYMGTYRASDGRILLTEYQNGQWIPYQDYTQAITLPYGWRQPVDLTVVPLNIYASQYCYVWHDGPSNFSSWVQQAARISGK